LFIVDGSGQPVADITALAVSHEPGGGEAHWKKNKR
jgi:hypothetical protein